MSDYAALAEKCQLWLTKWPNKPWPHGLALSAVAEARPLIEAVLREASSSLHPDGVALEGDDLQEKLTEAFDSEVRTEVRAQSAEAALATLRAQKDGAYHERDQLVAALSKYFPSWRTTHVGEWEEEWRNIIFIDLPTGQVSWHVHDAEMGLFWHVPVGDAFCIWDGHSTEEKYRRLAALGVPPEGEP